MRTLILSVVLVSIFCSALGQLSAGINWQGTWSQNIGGTLYLCVDEATNTVHGSYGNLGLITGYVLGNTYHGYWYESGYDRPFGPFEVTINDAGTSFSGTWSYYQSPGNFSAPNTYTGSKTSGAKPDSELQCLTPAALGGNVQGVFEQYHYICDHSSINWLDSDQPLYSAFFDGFGKVQGYSPDSGNSLLLSDFYFPDDEDVDKSKFRPAVLSSTYEDQPENHGADDDDSIYTSRAIVGRFVGQNRFCGWFWYGFYSTVVNTVPICFDRTENVPVDPQACAYSQSDVKQQDHKYDDGNTSQLIQNIQDAFDALTLPEFNIDIVKGDDNGAGPAPNGKDINEVQYIEQPCNSASGLILSVASLFILSFAF